MKADKKVAHPFLVPDNFHEEFKSEFLSSIEKEEKYKEEKSKGVKFAVKLLEYAAVIAVAFMIGRYSSNVEGDKLEAHKMESIYNQVSDEDIMAYIIDNDLISKL